MPQVEQYICVWCKASGLEPRWYTYTGEPAGHTYDNEPLCEGCVDASIEAQKEFNQ